MKVITETNDMPTGVRKKASGNRTKTPPNSREITVSDLAHASFDAVKPFINVFDPGHRFLDRVVHSISADDWELNRQWKEFKAEHPNCKLSDAGLHHKNGIPFNPYNDIVRNIYSPKHVEAHINDGRPSYYTSGLNGFCLPYIDLDWHHQWQMDGDKAIALINQHFPFAFGRSSPRGHNWYPKVSYLWPQLANETIDFLEEQLKLLFLSNGILCDIEVKGTITFGGKSGRLGKLPFNCISAPNSSNDNWNFRQLAKFKAAPTINCQRLRKIAESFSFDSQMVGETRALKKRLEAAEENKIRPAIVPAIRLNRPAKEVSLPDQASPWFGAVAPNMPTPEASGITAGKRVSPRRTTPFLSGDESGDAFDRAKNAVLTMRREHGWDLTEENVLDHMQETGLYTGDWFDSLKNREYRIRWWMAISAKTFDPKKCSSRNAHNESRRRPSAEYVRKHLNGCLAVAQGIECAHTLRSSSNRTICTDEDKATFLCLLKFYTENPNSDGTMPVARFESDWKRLKDEGVIDRSWSPNRFTAIKNWLSDLNLLTWTDNTYRIGYWAGEKKVNGVATKWTASEKLLEMMALVDKEEQKDVPNPLYIALITELARSLKRCAYVDRIRAVQRPFRLVIHYDDDEVDRSVGYFELMAA